MATPDRITEIKTSLAKPGHTQSFACDVALRTEQCIVVYYRMTRDYNLHGIPLQAGNLTVGYFWFDRPYNLYHWIERDGTTSAWYFNIGDVTSFDGSTLEWHDLAVDILATPSGRIDILDEDELPADLDPALRSRIMHARDVVLGALAELTSDADITSAHLLATVPASPPVA